MVVSSQYLIVNINDGKFWMTDPVPVVEYQ